VGADTFVRLRREAPVNSLDIFAPCRKRDLQENFNRTDRTTSISILLGSCPSAM